MQTERDEFVDALRRAAFFAERADALNDEEGGPDEAAEEPGKDDKRGATLSRTT
jgi:hypothetical protein